MNADSLIRAPRPRPASLSRLDVDIVRYVTRFQHVRGCHTAAFTNASPWTIRKHLRGLADHKLVVTSVLSLYLRDRDGKILPSQAHVWRTTPQGQCSRVNGKRPERGA